MLIDALNVIGMPVVTEAEPTAREATGGPPRGASESGGATAPPTGLSATTTGFSRARPKGSTEPDELQRWLEAKAPTRPELLSMSEAEQVLNDWLIE